MAGNILYIPYTVIIVIALLGTATFIQLKKGKAALQKFLLVSVPITFVLQVYFWNDTFNDYVKSFVFPSKVFTCSHADDLKDIAIPLPRRTVFHAKSDGCSPLYSTYVDDREFIRFYEEVLPIMKSRREIADFHYVERQNDNWADEKGFQLDLVSGATVEILIYRGKGMDRWGIKMDYQE